MKLEYCRHIFEKYLNIEFHENPSRVVPWGQTNGRTDMANLTVAFRNFANAPKNTSSSHLQQLIITLLTAVCVSWVWVWALVIVLCPLAVNVAHYVLLETADVLKTVGLFTVWCLQLILVRRTSRVKFHNIRNFNSVALVRDSSVPRNFFRGGGSTNSVEDREYGDLGAVAP
jgi:hypothetical protein